MPLTTTEPTMVTEDDVVPGRHGIVPIRRYHPLRPVIRLATPADDGTVPRTAADTTVVWLHGGAFSHGGLDQLESHAVATGLVEAGHPVVAVDYRRVPPWSWWRRPKPGVLDGVRYPVPLEDVLDVLAAVRAEVAEAHRAVTRHRVVLGGASAGACLAAAAALRLAREGGAVPDGLVLAYGTFHAALPPLSDELRERVRGRHGIVQFRPEIVERMNRNYAGRVEAMGDPFAFPGGHDLSGLPPIFVLDADRDTLRASGEAFAGELDAWGVETSHEVVPESTHGFLDRPGTPAFDDGMSRIIRRLAA